jgi:hypothetical protein
MKNTITAKNKRPGSNKDTGRSYEYDKKYQATTERKKYRVELNKENRKAGTYGNKDGKDMSHTKSGKLVKEAQSKNRARNRGKK